MRNDAWTEDEDAVLSENYSKIGPKGCLELIPHRSFDGIRHRARLLGLSAAHLQGSGKHSDPINVVYRHVTNDELARLKRSIPKDTRSFTGRLMGDPLPGRSALDDKRARP